MMDKLRLTITAGSPKLDAFHNFHLYVVYYRVLFLCIFLMLSSCCLGQL